MIAEQISLAEQVRMSSARLERVNALMRRFTERGVIAGAVTLIARRGQIAHLQAHGHMDVEAARPMQSDALFRLASMTKPVISVALLSQVEEGKREEEEELASL